jgi:CRP/FNR family transcriptional regulator, cyclic AMP receptor protein
MPQRRLLQEHPFTKGLSDTQIERLAALASQVEFDENDVILADGARSQGFFLLLSGSVAVELRAPRFGVEVQSLGPGKAFGWSSLLEDQDTLFQVRAREHTTALRLDGAQLRRCFKGDPELGAELLHRILRVVAGRMRATEVRFAEFCGMRM